MAVRREALGFGFIPSESQHHFLVMISKNPEGHVIIYERFRWQEDTDPQTIDFNNDKPKVELSKHKWKLIEDILRIEFNNRIKKDNIIIGKWHLGQIPVQRLYGKEMVLLTWAIEDSDPSVIPIAIKNWLGLSPEERWWLYTMTNAASGNLGEKRGWRKAIRYALTENPVDESSKQMSLFDMAIKRQIDD